MEEGHMAEDRRAGVLLHPVSLPGRYGIGEIGKEAYRFVDFLERAGIGLWQVLPLGPTGYGDSPYQALSTFAGNPLLISLDRLVEQGDLPARALEQVPAFPEEKIDYQMLRTWKDPLLREAAGRFLEGGDSRRLEAFGRFCEKKAFWLDDFTHFAVIKEHFDEKAEREGAEDARWNIYWDRKLALRNGNALAAFSREHQQEIEEHRVLQFFFHEQWLELKAYANEKGISIIGDIPIFVSPDSADIWADRKLFLVDGNGRLSHVAGVPPDYFSVTGQRWGNPLYDWEAMKKNGFAWWIRRIEAILELVDIIRTDHFRGFEAYWQIPAEEETAVKGEWIKAPGVEFFEAVLRTLGELPILAEDLGVITPEVVELRERFNFLGMKVLQFAFEYDDEGALTSENGFLPHTYDRNCVVYTGTHDNDTTLGWYRSIDETERDLVRRYLARPDEDIVWDLIRAAYSSVARYAIIPMQDFLVLDTDARMNMPSTIGGNWNWRMAPGAANDWVAARSREMAWLYKRLPEIRLPRQEETDVQTPDI
jgi:4-alpha-glucanotransferase